MAFTLTMLSILARIWVVLRRLVHLVRQLNLACTHTVHDTVAIRRQRKTERNGPALLELYKNSVKENSDMEFTSVTATTSDASTKSINRTQDSLLETETFTNDDQLEDNLQHHEIDDIFALLEK